MGQLSDAFVFEPESNSWLHLTPGGVRFPPRTGHAACAVGAHSVVVFGGWRLRPCAEARPCGQFLADLHVLRSLPVAADEASAPAPPEPFGAWAGQTSWERPAVDGMPPLPRRGHSMTALHAVTPAAARDETDAGEEEGEGEVQIVLLFGLGWWLNSTTHESHAMYLNDVHILSHVNATWAWRHLRVQGSPPKARASHSATLTPDGQRLLVFGGMDEAGPLADAHLLDLSHEPPIWWQLHPVGQAPSEGEGRVREG